MSDSVIPIIDTRTCREKQDAVIDNLWGAVDTITRRCATLAAELEALRARVAALEAQHAQDALPITGPPSDSAFTIRTDGSLERNASTATPGQTYTWLSGDAWSQYCEEQP